MKIPPEIWAKTIPSLSQAVSKPFHHHNPNNPSGFLTHLGAPNIINIEEILNLPMPSDFLKITQISPYRTVTVLYLRTPA